MRGVGESDLRSVVGGVSTGHETRLGLNGAVCGSCGRALLMLETIWSDDRWLFCDEDCAAAWTGKLPWGPRDSPVGTIHDLDLYRKEREARALEEETGMEFLL